MQYFQTYVPKFIQCLRERGAWTTVQETLRVLYRDVSEWRFDRKWDIHTRGVKVYSGDEIDSAYVHAEMYQATSPYLFRRVMQSLRHARLPRTFIDLGSGKGRVLFMAAEWGFKRLIGVELDPGLAEIAKENIRHFQCQNSKRLEFKVACQDAGTFSFPDENAVVFLFHPFDQKVIWEVLCNLRSSVSVRRERIIIYLNPVWKSLFRDPDEFEPLVISDTCAIYRMVCLPAGAAAQ